MDINQITASIAKQARLKAKRMNLEAIHSGMLAWLGDLKFPPIPGADSWEDLLQVFEQDAEDAGDCEGVQMRFAIRFYTKANQYLMSIFESMVPGEAGNFILSVHVNWQNKEWRKRKALDEAYAGGFDDMLKASHTIWAQSFTEPDLTSALSAGALAILGHELQPEPPVEKIGEQFKTPVVFSPKFPKPDLD